MGCGQVGTVAGAVADVSEDPPGGAAECAVVVAETAPGSGVGQAAGTRMITDAEPSPSPTPPRSSPVARAPFGSRSASESPAFGPGSATVDRSRSFQAQRHQEEQAEEERHTQDGPAEPRRGGRARSAFCGAVSRGRGLPGGGVVSDRAAISVSGPPEADHRVSLGKAPPRIGSVRLRETLTTPSPSSTIAESLVSVTSRSRMTWPANREAGSDRRSRRLARLPPGGAVDRELSRSRRAGRRRPSRSGGRPGRSACSARASRRAARSRRRRRRRPSGTPSAAP